MAWNTTFAKYRSTELAALDCGYSLKQARTDLDDLWGSFTASATNVLGIGECVAMVRVPAGAVVLGADLYWTAGAGAGLFAVGDPFGCARFIGPATSGSAAIARGIFHATCGTQYGVCGTMTKMGKTGDGCGIGYTYTCETDILVTNLYNNDNATVGGWAGSSPTTAGGHVGVAVSSGTITLLIKLKPV